MNPIFFVATCHTQQKTPHTSIWFCFGPLDQRPSSISIPVLRILRRFYRSSSSCTLFNKKSWPWMLVKRDKSGGTVTPSRCLGAISHFIPMESFFYDSSFFWAFSGWSLWQTPQILLAPSVLRPCQIYQRSANFQKKYLHDSTLSQTQVSMH